ncbi:MAG: nitroreductase family protein [Clostridia bacterium]|nr:nitroreductase family protein [Clostridia bacterium]HPJ76032.1 nitroreductase family protein [Clostridia bacterium]HXK71654.1 nitroreductase family protein [Clostridia bacterium]
MERVFKYDIMQEIKDRWSPRAYSEEMISKDDLYAILEAASFAPSCFNEQPWRFVLADDEQSIKKMRSILYSQNLKWAEKAPVLLLIAAKKTFSLDGEQNFWHMFDTGTAWGFLSLEAQKRGIITHAMGGFSKKKARKEFNIPDDLEIITVVAIGRYGDINQLEDELREREKPETRQDISRLIINKEPYHD